MRKVGTPHLVKVRKLPFRLVGRERRKRELQVPRTAARLLPRVKQPAYAQTPNPAVISAPEAVHRLQPRHDRVRNLGESLCGCGVFLAIERSQRGYDSDPMGGLRECRPSGSFSRRPDRNRSRICERPALESRLAIRPGAL